MRTKVQTVPLVSEVSFLSGGTPRMSDSRFWGGDIPWVSSGEMTESRISLTERRVTEEGAQNGTKRVPANTVLVVVRGMSLAKEFRISITERDVTFNQDIKALRPSERIDPWFLFYYLKSQRHSIRDSATDASHGTKKLETRVLEQWPLPLLDIQTQRSIASVLSTYDNLIENNRRRIQLLEQAARLLYKEWFVHIRFPGHEHVKIVDGVPDGWEKSTVGDSTSFLSRGITPKYDDDAPGLVINQKCIRNRMVNLELARRQSKHVPALKFVQFGDVLINSTGAGTLGRVAQFLLENNECTVDSHITIIRPQENVPVHFFGLHITGLEPYIATLGRGATNQTELSKDDIAALEIVLPTPGLAQIFERTVAPIFHQIRILSEQIQKLAKSRDFLLPKLMNGEVTV
ncbi:type I restriction enzyme, S subunit [Desulfonatronum thiosulfatophilum]|uniref:Type I restriction enzyme, S subunit n=1 Tax=Desulfonatronum thiosulfatophilum TaxID=617002 RepID=A0A1G6AMC5_9BACT|nr:restriction endonuclease subunit S [Desulfonatronum thiosulfatophilum]SDB09511.1 type I restriction enzyme, S subunit [Desulfonatronum thiosulfatophilum]